MTLVLDSPPELAPLVRAALTPREAEIAEALLLGLTNKEISARIGISPRTVKAHLCKMSYKCGLYAPIGSAEERDGANRIRLARHLLGRAE